MSNLPTVVNENEVRSELTPQQQVDRGAEMARVLQGVVKKSGLAKRLGNKEYLQYEAWQTIGRFFNCTAQTEWTRQMDDGIGWEAKVNIVNGDGRIIASAESMCARDEKSWKDRPEYALRSMAQTRAGGKAFRQAFAWIAVLGGYAATPAEEMDSVDVPAEQTQVKPTSAQKATLSKLAKLKKAVMSDAIAEFGNKDEALEFITWNLKSVGAPEWTEKLLQDLLDNFQAQVSAYREATAPEDLPL
jgi:hypothetical protein